MHHIPHAHPLNHRTHEHLLAECSTAQCIIHSLLCTADILDYSHCAKMVASCSDLCCKAAVHSEKEVLYDSATLLYTVAACSATCMWGG